MKPDNDTVPHSQCSICSTLNDREYAYQKYGAESGDSYLPSSVERLKITRDFQPYGSRKLQLLQCPECCTYYLYKTDYEYLVNGSEDEEFLFRLTNEQAAEYLSRPVKD